MTKRHRPVGCEQQAHPDALGYTFFANPGDAVNDLS